MDDKRAVLLTLLDLSAAFDTVDNKIMINKLENVFGITGTALKWLKSYLPGCDVTQLPLGLLCSPRISIRTNHVFSVYQTYRRHHSVSWHHFSFVCR